MTHLEIVYDAFAIEKIVGNDKKVPRRNGKIN